jgi:excisionase family DNA binding protein
MRIATRGVPMPNAALSTAVSASAPFDPLALPIPKAAALIGVSTSEVYRMLRRGELLPVRFGKGRGLLVRYSDLAAFIDQRARKYRPRKYRRDFRANPINPKRKVG